MTASEKIFAYYLVDLIAKGEKEAVETIEAKAKSKTLVPYLLGKEPQNKLGRARDFSDLGDVMAEYDYTLDLGKFQLESHENGLALLLCLIVNYC